MPINQESWDCCIEYMRDAYLKPGHPLADSDVGYFVKWFRADADDEDDEVQQRLADLRLIMEMDPSLGDRQLRFLRIWAVTDQYSAQEWEQEDVRFIITDDNGDPMLAKNWAELRENLLTIADECCYEDDSYEVALYDIEAPNWREPFAKVALKMITQVSVSLVGGGFIDGEERLASHEVKMKLSEPDIIWPL